MPNGDSLLNLLACPRCRRPLAPAGDGQACARCRVEYPTVDAMLWLFPRPDAALAEWRQRLTLVVRRYESDAERLAEERRAPRLLDATRRRLEHIEAACRDQARRLAELLADIGLETADATGETLAALETRLPAHQGLATYYANLHRDWCWGEAENRASLEILTGLLGDAGEPRTVAVLGSGAGRLACDLHAAIRPVATVGLDINPLLLAVARRASAAEPVDLWEFPLAPRTLEDHARLNRLVGPEPAPPGLHFVFGDVLRAPFAPEAFDVVVTPWLLDILSQDLRHVAPRINRMLKPGGRWLNFGSLAFAHGERALCYSLEEVAEIVAASGFAMPDPLERELPYMASPASRHARRETVVAFATPKTGEAELPAAHRAVPDWITRSDLPVPELPHFRSQALSTRVYAFILAMIDGRRTIRDMAAMMEEQRLMPRADAEQALRGFLTRVWEESRLRSEY